MRLALYDIQKRKEYAREAREAFVHTEAGREISIKKSMLDTARTFLGTRYRYGSSDPKLGFDCSGLLYHVGKLNQIQLPRSSALLAKSAPHIPWKKARPGDLVFFGDRGRIHHVGIVSRTRPKELWVIHSTNQRGVIDENVLESSYWNKRLLFAIDFTTLKELRSLSDTDTASINP